MEMTTENVLAAGDLDRKDVARGPIRGSTLLLAGRMLTLGSKLGTQVLIVRAFSQTDYGAWAYCLALVTFLHGLALLGLDKTLTRFFSIYREREEYEKLFGTLLLVVGAVIAMGALIVGALYVWPSLITRSLNDQSPLALLLILIFLVPVEAVDTVLVSLFACFGKSRAIFLRRHVLGPVLRLGAVALLIFAGAGVTYVALGYLAASLLGVLIYCWFAFQMLRAEGLLRHLDYRRLSIPVREVFSFALPLFSAEAVIVLSETLGVFLLGYFHNLDQVALFQVAVPLAAVNLTVMRSFTLLYVPAAARLYAKEDYAGINDLYWRTAVWMAVLSFPVFALTFSAARSLVVFLYGERYEQAGIFLALLALGQYVNAALGFNGITLKVLNKVRYILVINLLTALTNVAVGLLLVPFFGALGAAIATSGTLIAHNILKQVGLRLTMGVSLFDSRYSTTYLVISLSAAGLLGAQLALPRHTLTVLALAVVASLIVLVLCKRTLRVGETFPELLRLPWMKRVLT